MPRLASRLVVGSPLEGPLRWLRDAAREWRWRVGPRVPPPPASFKRRVLKAYGKRFRLGTLVETGTYLGGTILSLRGSFQVIWSIELDDALYERAVELFKADPAVKLLHGDSAAMLQQVLGQLTQPALFWLDAHYSEDFTAKGSKETPILEELELVMGHAVKGHVVLIDDARSFVGERDYPTIDEIKRFIADRDPGASVVVEDDIIRIHR